MKRDVDLKLTQIILAVRSVYSVLLLLFFFLIMMPMRNRDITYMNDIYVIG